jgi:hypothetical protein
MTLVVPFGRRRNGDFFALLRLLAILVLGAAVQSAFGDLAIETETVRVLEPGHFELGAAGEFQTSPNGLEYGALPGADIAAAGGPPEIAGNELVAGVGIRGHVNRKLDIFGSFTYDNNKAKLFRTGFAVK